MEAAPSKLRLGRGFFSRIAIEQKRGVLPYFASFGCDRYFCVYLF